MESQGRDLSFLFNTELFFPVYVTQFIYPDTYKLGCFHILTIISRTAVNKYGCLYGRFSHISNIHRTFVHKVFWGATLISAQGLLMSVHSGIILGWLSVPYGILGIETELAECKASDLPPILSLQPPVHKFIYNILFGFFIRRNKIGSYPAVLSGCFWLGAQK